MSDPIYLDRGCTYCSAALSCPYPVCLVEMEEDEKRETYYAALRTGQGPRHPDGRDARSKQARS